MATKTLKIKRVLAWSVYNNLKSIPPKDYPTTGEIKSTLSDIMPVFKPAVDEYSKMMDRVTDVQEKLSNKEIDEKEVDKLVAEINKDWKAYNKVGGIEIIDIEISEEGLKTLKAQFEREGWGKKWVANIEEFGELLATFEAAVK